MLRLQTRIRGFRGSLYAYVLLAAVCARPLCGQSQQTTPPDGPDLAPAAQSLPLIGEPLDDLPAETAAPHEIVLSAWQDDETQSRMPALRFVSGRLWFEMDILGWAMKGVRAPPLATTSPPGAVFRGVLGMPGTKVLFGDEVLHNEMRTGGRLTVGWWFDPDQQSGLEWQYFGLDGNDIRFHANAVDHNGILARPVITPWGVEDALVLDPIVGSLNITSDLQFTSTGILYREQFFARPQFHLDYLIGYRHAHLFDQVRIRQINRTFGFSQSMTSDVLDVFHADNQFNGLDLGLKSASWTKNGKFALTILAKLALGASSNNVDVNGSSTATISMPPFFTPTTVNSPVGILARSSSLGRHSQHEFGVLGEVGYTLVWRPTSAWQLSLGYTWIGWSNIARALLQVNRTYDSGFGYTLPAFHMHTTDFWAQGINGGFTYQF